MAPERKKFRKYSASGLGMGPKGQLYAPHTYTEGERGPWGPSVEAGPGLNNFGLPEAVPGDYVAANLPTNELTALTVGRVQKVIERGAPAQDVLKIETVLRRHTTTWRYGACVLSEEQVREFLQTLYPEEVLAPWAKKLAAPPPLPGPVQTMDF